MNISDFLKRIDFTDKITIENKTLIKLHEHHVFNVPFENLDVHYKRIFGLEIDELFRKIVYNRRGGFCYELNTLFNELLINLGFNSKIIEARIFDEFGEIGPRYDHMAIFVETDKKFLIDVGFGDLFIKPLEIRNGIQSDGRNQFLIEELDNHDFLLSMCSDKTNFYRKYTFNLCEVQTNEFKEICLDKQTNHSSYFVKNTICTKPTSSGRITLFNDRLLEKRGNERIEKQIYNETHLIDVLKTSFGILIH